MIEVGLQTKVWRGCDLFGLTFSSEKGAKLKSG
jgi:hypothetical protein